MLSTDGLVHIIDSGLLRQKKNIRAVGMDMDGFLTDLHKREIYELLIGSIMRFLPPKLSRELESFKVEDFASNGRFPLGWYIDTQKGPLLLSGAEGNIMKAKRGDIPLPPSRTAKMYPQRRIDISDCPDPDHKKPRFLQFCDGFDYIEGIVKATVGAITWLPKGSLKEVDIAWYKSHHDEKGFKKEILENLGKYGIKKNPEIVSFIEALHNSYTTFLLTSSPKWYVYPVLEELGIENKLDLIITDARKPGYFTEKGNELSQMLASSGISPGEVFYGGDHLRKDVIGPRKAGYLAGLRMPKEHIEIMERKLEKYGEMEFTGVGPIVLPVCGPTEEGIANLSDFPKKILDYAQVLTTKVQNLAPILLH